MTSIHTSNTWRASSSWHTKRTGAHTTDSTYNFRNASVHRCSLFCNIIWSCLWEVACPRCSLDIVMFQTCGFKWVKSVVFEKDQDVQSTEWLIISLELLSYVLIFIAALSFVSFFFNFLSLCRKAQRRIDLLKQQIEDSLEKELVAHQYLTSIVILAEKITYERDQLIHMVVYTNIPPTHPPTQTLTTCKEEKYTCAQPHTF